MKPTLALLGYLLLTMAIPTVSISESESAPEGPVARGCQRVLDEVECGKWSDWKVKKHSGSRERLDLWVQYCIDQPEKRMLSRRPIRVVQEIWDKPIGGETVTKTQIDTNERTVYRVSARGQVTKSHITTATENGTTIETTVEIIDGFVMKVTREARRQGGSSMTTWTFDLMMGTWTVSEPDAPKEPTIPERSAGLKEWSAKCN